MTDCFYIPPIKLPDNSWHMKTKNLIKSFQLIFQSCLHDHKMSDATCFHFLNVSLIMVVPWVGYCSFILNLLHTWGVDKMYEVSLCGWWEALCSNMIYSDCVSLYSSPAVTTFCYFDLACNFPWGKWLFQGKFVIFKSVRLNIKQKQFNFTTSI